MATIDALTVWVIIGCLVAIASNELIFGEQKPEETIATFTVTVILWPIYLAFILFCLGLFLVNKRK